MKKVLTIAMLSLLISGCGKTKVENRVSDNKKKDEIKMNIDCNGDVNTPNLKENDTFKCTLLNDEYEFTVTSITADEVIIKASDTGLSPVSDKGGISLREKITEFTIPRDKETKISTQSMDYSEDMILYWK